MSFNDKIIKSFVLHSIESAIRQFECEDGDYEKCLVIRPLFLMLI